MMLRRRFQSNFGLADIEDCVAGFKLLLEATDPDTSIRQQLSRYVWIAENPKTLHRALPFTDDLDEWVRAAVCHAILDSLHHRKHTIRAKREPRQQRVYEAAYNHTRRAWSGDQ